MKEIFFPIFNLKLNIYNVAIDLFGIKIYWYGIIIVSAMIISLLLCKKDSGKYGIKFDTIVEWFLWVLPISIIGARIYYVTFNPVENIFDFRSGGLAIYGALIFGSFVTAIYCKIKKIKISDLLDYIVPYLALSQAIGRWGNFINTEAYGTETLLPWRMGIYVNDIYTEVHPTFLYESLAALIIFGILIYIKRKYSGQITSIYLMLYGFARMFIEGIRIDSLIIYNMRISQIISIILFVTFFVILLKREIRCRKTSESIQKAR